MWGGEGDRQWMRWIGCNPVLSSPPHLNCVPCLESRLYWIKIFEIDFCVFRIAMCGELFDSQFKGSSSPPAYAVWCEGNVFSLSVCRKVLSCHGPVWEEGYPCPVMVLPGGRGTHRTGQGYPQTGQRDTPNPQIGPGSIPYGAGSKEDFLVQYKIHSASNSLHLHPANSGFVTCFEPLKLHWFISVRWLQWDSIDND